MVAGTGKIRQCDGGSCQGHDDKRQDTVFLEVSTGSQSITHDNGRTMSVPTFKNYNISVMIGKSGLSIVK